MKNCKNSNKCCYGHCSEKDTCAYDLSFTNEDICPVYAEDWENIIDELELMEEF